MLDDIKSICCLKPFSVALSFRVVRLSFFLGSRQRPPPISRKARSNVEAKKKNKRENVVETKQKTLTATATGSSILSRDSSPDISGWRYTDYSLIKVSFYGACSIRSIDVYIYIYIMSIKCGKAISSNTGDEATERWNGLESL